MGIRANIWATWQVTLRSFNHSGLNHSPDIPLTLSGMHEILDSTLMSRNALKSILFLSQLLSVGPRVRNNVNVHMGRSALENRHRSASEDKTSNISKLGLSPRCHRLTSLCSFGEWVTYLAGCKACLTQNSLLIGKHRFQDHLTHL